MFKALFKIGMFLNLLGSTGWCYLDDYTRGTYHAVVLLILMWIYKELFEEKK